MDTIRLLPFSTADGAHNMAADEVLLESAAAGVASLRFYAWSEPTLSLGYFQPETTRRAYPLPYVRRPTGGLTLVHHHELTYALALPRAKPQAWLCRMHQLINQALRRLGVELIGAACDRKVESSNALCFQHITAGDLLTGNVKVVGSAQRKQRSALLQHGAILLSSSSFTPTLPGIRELTGKNLELSALRQALLAAWHADTGQRPVLDDWSKKERLRTEDLVQNKYSQTAWNARR